VEAERVYGRGPLLQRAYAAAGHGSRHRQPLPQYPAFSAGRVAAEAAAVITTDNAKHDAGKPISRARRADEELTQWRKTKRRWSDWAILPRPRCTEFPYGNCYSVIRPEPFIAPAQTAASRSDPPCTCAIS